MDVATTPYCDWPFYGAPKNQPENFNLRSWFCYMKTPYEKEAYKIKTGYDIFVIDTNVFEFSLAEFKKLAERKNFVLEMKPFYSAKEWGLCSPDQIVINTKAVFRLRGKR
jgi:hypothetical protein